MKFLTFSKERVLLLDGAGKWIMLRKSATPPWQKVLAMAWLGIIKLFVPEQYRGH